MDVVYTTIKDFLDSILGTYIPMVTTLPDGSVIPLGGVAGVDYPYLIRAAVFLLTMYCVYKIIGGLICKNY